MSLYAKGDRVAQANYGAGTVIDSNARHTVIDFDEHGRRTFVTSLMALEETTEPAPIRKRRARRAQRERES
ncbi:MAG: hypothetical protein ACRD09_13245 [Vicinamibacterales bacterium]